MWLICTGAIDGADILCGSWQNVYEYTAEAPSAAEHREKTQHLPSCPSPDLRRYVMRPLTLKCATQSFVAHNYLFSYYSALTELIPLLLWRTLQPAKTWTGYTHGKVVISEPARSVYPGPSKQIIFPSWFWFAAQRPLDQSWSPR